MSGSMLISWRSFWRSKLTSDSDPNEDEHECRSSIRLIDKKRINLSGLHKPTTAQRLIGNPRTSYQKNLKLHEVSDCHINPSGKSGYDHDKSPILKQADNKLQLSTTSIQMKKAETRNHSRRPFQSKSISRLSSIIKLSIQLTSLITTVPILIICIQQEANRQRHLEPEQRVVNLLKPVTPVNLYRSYPVPNIEQSRFNRPQHDLQLQQSGANWTSPLRWPDHQQSAAIAIQHGRQSADSTQLDRNDHLLAPDLWHSEQQMTRLGRPTFLSGFVANQGQRILRNLANSTIAELIGQPIVRRPLPGAQQATNLPLNTDAKHLPTMGKLYSFLFANNPSQVGLADKHQQPSSIYSADAGNRNIANTEPPLPAKRPAKEAIQSAPSDLNQVYLNNNNQNRKNPQKIGQQYTGDDSWQQPIRQQVINLSAPYESRPRLSISPGQQALNRLSNSKRPQVNLAAGDENTGDNKLRRGSRSNMVQPDGSNSHVLYDHQQQQMVDSANTNEYQGNIFHHPNELTAESGSENPGTNYEAINMQQHEAAQAEESAEPDQRKQEVIYAEDGGELVADLQQDGESSDTQMAQLMQDPTYLGIGNYGTRKVASKQRVEAQDDGKDFSVHDNLKQTGLPEMPTGDQVDHIVPTGHDSPINDMDQSSRGQGLPFEQQENQAAHQQVPSETEDELDQMAQGQKPHELMSIPSGKLQGEQINLINGALRNDARDNVSMFDHEEEMERHPSDRPDFQYSFANETNQQAASTISDDSFLNLRLPSQYDATIRLPPEGYYDDYYKPASTNLAYHSSSNLLIDNPESLPEYPLNALNVNGAALRANQQRQADHFQADNNDSSSNANSTISGNSQHQSDHISSSLAKQYFMNQRPLKQNEAPLDQNIEFVVPNNVRKNSTVPSSKSISSADKIEVDLQPAFEGHGYANKGGQNSSRDSNLSDESGQANRSFIDESSYGKTGSVVDANNDLQNSIAHLNEDNIELIIANTNNSSRDPLSNEKLINYISENGQNGTRQAGKPARNTFVNKEMNEFLPFIGDHSNGNQRGDQTTPSPMLRVINDDDGDSPVGQQQVRAPSLDGNVQPRRLTSTSDGGQNETANENGTFADEQVNADEEDQIRRASTGAESPSFGRYNKNGRSNELPRSPGTNSLAHQLGPQPEEMKSLRSSKQVTLTRPSLQPYIREQVNAKHRQRAQPNISSNHNYNQVNPTEQSRNRDRREKRVKKSDSLRQHLLRRQPVTQVHLNPKNLIAIPPTAAPSAISPMETIANIPSKMKKLRNNQPDKNELMNELLTALDRVKVAIYNLQPLTARMNAIYRKSITSNTRDIIMDHHKGTYANRYPPGDYDNVYDRMRPQDQMLDRQQESSRRKGRPTQSSSGSRSRADMMAGGESTSSAVYLPAPQEVIESYRRANNRLEDRSATLVPSGLKASAAPNHMDALNSSESKIVATGIGRRLGNGQIRGSLSLIAGTEELRYDDNNNNPKIEFGNLESASDVASSSHLLDSAIDGAGDSAAPNFVPSNQLLADPSSPLFGYRITIYQSPVDEDDGEPNNDQFSYEIEGDTDSSSPVELKSSADLHSASNISEVSRRDGKTDMEENIGDDDDDTMATSESTVTESHLSLGSSSMDPKSVTKLGTNELMDLNKTIGFDQEAEETKESMEKMEKKKKKGSAEKEKKNKKESKEKEDKKKEKSKKSYSKKAKGEEGKKKKKEYKKIKKKKGVMSKEKKVLHRDKHIKAHDRGAAKEKALKERTQIEFFEREQIVDDEFEKGKKSLVKAGWQSGHDQKKSLKDSSGEQISMGGSHYVSHSPKDAEHEKKHGASMEASSGKKANKFMKKDMEAKGKKFKGWREKGYKIITETEFIDRGSLHDSAYKKRDKGGAHHQKFKKHEDTSEGHHGSMYEEHKKSHKKEEKKNKMHEKKGMKSKSAEHESEKSKMKKKHDKAHKDKESLSEESKDDDKIMLPNDLEQSVAAQAEPPAQKQDDASSSDESTEESVLREHQRSSRPLLIKASPSTYRPSLSPLLTFAGGSQSDMVARQQHANSATLSRLLNANHDEEPTKYIHLTGSGGDDRLNATFGFNSTSSPPTVANETIALSRQRVFSHAIEVNHMPGPNITLNQLPRGLTDSFSANRLPEPALAHHQRQYTPIPPSRQPNILSHLNGSQSSDRSNTTILDIVDNLTGRQINKNKIGTYELEGHNMIANDNPAITNKNSANINGLPLNRTRNHATRHISMHSKPANLTEARQQQQLQHYRSLPGNHQPAQGPTNSGRPTDSVGQPIRSEIQPSPSNDNVDGSLLLSLLHRVTNAAQQVKQNSSPAERQFGDNGVIQRPIKINQANLYTPSLTSRTLPTSQSQSVNPSIMSRQQSAPALQPPADSHLTATQYEVASRLVRMMQNAGRMAAANTIVSPPEKRLQTGGNLMGSTDNSHIVSGMMQSEQQNAFLQPNLIIPSYHKQTTPPGRPLPIFVSPAHSQLNFNGARNDPIGLVGTEQLLDYELYPLRVATR